MRVDDLENCQRQTRTAQCPSRRFEVLATMEMIQSGVRILHVLEELNASNGSSSSDIALATGLSRGTVHRMLETLTAAGYVRKDGHIGAYWLEPKTRQLGIGYSDQDWILDRGAKAIEHLHKDIHWCLTLSIPDGNDMWIRIATRLKNPQGGTKTFAGSRRRLGQSSDGHVYLAHCTPIAQEHALDKMYDPSERELAFLKDQVPVSRSIAKNILDNIKERGFSIYEANVRTKLASIPIMRNGKATGAVTVAYFASAMDDAQVIKGLVPRLKEAGSYIGR